MLYSLTKLVACLLPAAGEPEGGNVFPKGIGTSEFVVREVKKDALTVKGSGLFNIQGDSVKLNVTKHSQFEAADVTMVEGKPAVSIKRIGLQDLVPLQWISVIFYSDGKELTLLRAVTSGGYLGLQNLNNFVEKLGGMVTLQTWPRNGLAFAVDLRNTKTTDADLAALSLMQGIAELDLAFTAVTDKGIASFVGYRNLTKINLTGTNVTDAAIVHLRRIKDLSEVNLAATKITDQGIARLVEERSQFNVCRVALGDKQRFRMIQQFDEGQLQFNYLMINDTYYGRYYVGPDSKPSDRRREATTYYHRFGPVGQVMSGLEWFKPAALLDYPSDVRMPASLVGSLGHPGLLPAGALVNLWSEPPFAVVRLNVGTHAAYGRPYQHINFFNSSPELTTYSLPGKGESVHFGFIRDALERGCNVQIIDGPERATIAKKAPKSFYAAWFVDITRNDLRDINTPLMTKDALADMMESTLEKGIVCYHVSHRYHDLVPAVVDAAASLKLSWKVAEDASNYRRDDTSHFGSTWVMVARRASSLQHLKSTKTDGARLEWSVPASTGKHVWRDDESHNLRILARPP